MIAWSTMPPRKGACSIFEVLVMSNVALTNEREVAICLVLTPAILKAEAAVSVKWIMPVKIQTNKIGLI